MQVAPTAAMSPIAVVGNARGLQRERRRSEASLEIGCLVGEITQDRP
jgi:hypothetical protein